jgi:hypothetical protein
MLLGCIFYYVFNKLSGYETFEKRQCQHFIQIPSNRFSIAHRYRRCAQPCSFMMYSATDYVEMLIIYEKCGRSAREAARVYAPRFPNRNNPDHKTILIVIARTVKTG